MELRGIQPGSSVYTRPRAATAATVEDVVSLGESRETGPSKPTFGPNRKQLPFLNRKLLSCVLAGCTFLIGGPYAMAQEPTAISLQENETARRYGLSADTLAALKPDTVAVLRTLPESLVRRYKDLNARQKEVMGRELRGKTGFLMVKFSNKEALINGSAAGRDAFPIVKDRLDDNVKKKRITTAEGEALKAAVDELKTLTRQQRAAVVEVILLETAPES